MISRRNILAGTAAATVAIALPAAASPTGDDTELLALYRRWIKIADEINDLEIAGRLAYANKPADIPAPPTVKFCTSTYHSPEELRHAMAQAPILAAEMRATGIDAKIIAAGVLEEMAKRDAGALADLEDQCRRYEEWRASHRLDEQDARHEALFEPMTAAADTLLALPARTDAGRLAKLDVAISRCTDEWSPDGDYAHRALESLLHDLEASTGMKATAPARLEAWRCAASPANIAFGAC